MNPKTSKSNDTNEHVYDMDFSEIEIIIPRLLLKHKELKQYKVRQIYLSLKEAESLSCQSKETLTYWFKKNIIRGRMLNNKIQIEAFVLIDFILSTIWQSAFNIIIQLVKDHNKDTNE